MTTAAVVAMLVACGGHSGSNPAPIADGAIVTPTQSGQDGTLALNVSGTSQGVNYQFLNVNGSATLSGQLVVNFLPPFTPQTGQKFVLVTAGEGIIGTFKTIITNGVAVTPTYSAKTFDITVN